MTSSPDIAIFLGKNIDMFYGPKKVRQHKKHMSPHSLMTVFAAIHYAQQFRTDTLVFSSGFTSGTEVRSEAQAMYDCFGSHVRNHSGKIYLEEESLDTVTNAIEVKKILESCPHGVIYLISVSYHLPRALKVFAHHGINAEPIASENLVSLKRSSVVDTYQRSFLTQSAVAREGLISMIENTIVGESVLRLAARLTRPGKRG